MSKGYIEYLMTIDKWKYSHGKMAKCKWEYLHDMVKD